LPVVRVDPAALVKLKLNLKAVVLQEKLGQFISVLVEPYELGGVV